MVVGDITPTGELISPIGDLSCANCNVPRARAHVRFPQMRVIFLWDEVAYDQKSMITPFRKHGV
jgi:hypothetical protein